MREKLRILGDELLMLFVKQRFEFRDAQPIEIGERIACGLHIRNCTYCTRYCQAFV